MSAACSASIPSDVLLSQANPGIENLGYEDEEERDAYVGLQVSLE